MMKAEDHPEADLPGPGDDADGPAEPPVFRCAEEGFEARSGTGLLGGFDGRDRRELRVFAVPDRQAQLIVSMHEHLHHELQWSTAWGLVAAMAGLLAEAGVDPDRLRGVAAVANSSCRQVHEIFATTISCGVLGVPEGRKLLAGNARYLAYLDEGLRLGGEAARWPWQFRESSVQMLLRSLMQPAALADVAARGFGRVRVRDLADPPAVQPDQRLLALAAGTGGWWDDTFGELLAEFPDRGGDRGGAWARTPPDGEAAMDQLKEWEESVLIPRLQAVATARLSDSGFTILDETGYLQAVDALTRSFTALAPAEWQVEVLTGRRRMSQEPLGAERESVMLHTAPAGVAVLSQEDLVTRSREFLFESPDSGPHVLALYLPRAVLMRQFRGFGDLGAGGAPVLSLAGRPVLARENERVVPLALLRPGLRPQQLAGMFSSVPTLVLTSLTALEEREDQESITELEAAYILMDLPLGRQVAAWAADGWTVRFRVVELRGERPLNLIVCGLDGLPGHFFLNYRGDAGFGELAQLLDRNPDRLLSGLVLADQTMTAITAITSWLLAAWWRFEEFGPE